MQSLFPMLSKRKERGYDVVRHSPLLVCFGICKMAAIGNLYSGFHLSVTS